MLGGSWSAHPEPYQRWFVKRLFEALNDFGAGVDRRAEAGAAPSRWSQLPEQLDGRSLARSYNDWVRARLDEDLGGLRHGSESASWSDLEQAHAGNERAGGQSRGPQRLNRLGGVIVGGRDAGPEAAGAKQVRNDQITIRGVHRLNTAHDLERMN